MVLLVVQTGCHTLRPMQESVPAPRQSVAIELNDRGRVLVGGQMGESVLRVHGTLVASSDSEVTLSVARTELMQGSSVVWTGETVRIPREGIRGFRIREFSRGRTAIMTVAVVTGLVVIGGLLTLAVGGSGRPGDGGGCSSCPPQ